MKTLRLHESLAPRPSKASYSRSLYDAIDSLKGPALPEQIAEVLPATDDADKWTQFKDQKLVRQRLKSAHAHGYFVEQPDGRWTIAPRRFYEKQQEHLAEQRLLSAARKDEDHPVRFKPSIADAVVTPTNKAAFALGFVIGVLTVLSGLGVYALVALS